MRRAGIADPGYELRAGVQPSMATPALAHAAEPAARGINLYERGMRLLRRAELGSNVAEFSFRFVRIGVILENGPGLGVERVGRGVGNAAQAGEACEGAPPVRGRAVSGRHASVRS